MRLIKLQGYFIHSSLDSKKDKFTKECIKDIYAQITKEKKFIKLTLHHSTKIIGELVAATLDKEGIKGSFVLYTDTNFSYKIVAGILTKVFRGLSIRFKIKHSEKLGNINYISKASILDVGLSIVPINKKCFITDESYEDLIKIIIRKCGDL